MTKTKLWAITLMVICTIFTSSAQIFYKMGADKLDYNLASIITNWHIIAGMVLYGLGAVLVILALRGGEVSVLYPIITSSYIWVSLGSSYFFGEIMNVFKWIGVFLIIFGIMLITFGQNDKKIMEFKETV